VRGDVRPLIQPAHREALTIPLFVLEELGLLAALTLC
jgi:hypothetical protein